MVFGIESEVLLKNNFFEIASPSRKKISEN